MNRNSKEQVLDDRFKPRKTRKARRFGLGKHLNQILRLGLRISAGGSDAAITPQLQGVRMNEFDASKLQQIMSVARRQAEELQRKMEEMVVEGSAGGGSVTVKMSGRRQVVGITIDPEVVRSGDVEMLQDLIVAAVNCAVKKIEEAMKSDISGLVSGLM